MTAERESLAERARFRDVFAVGEFRALWTAQVQSRIGDQLARVALAVLVYDRTSSAGLTALVYALTYLPPLLAAPLLSGLADRYSRRDVMAGTDVARALLVGAMAVPAVPLAAVLVLLVAMTCLQPVFSAARNAALPRMLPGERFPVGMSVVTTTDSVAQIVGFTLGGVLVGYAGGPHMALAVDAATFALSAVLLRFGLTPHRPAANGTGSAGADRSLLGGVRVILADRVLVGLVVLLWLYGFFLAPEALAAPYAHQIGTGPVSVGVLMAADLVGTAVGALVVGRIGQVRRRLMVPMAVGTGIPLLASALAPPLALTLVLWALSGLLAAYVVVGQTLFTQAVPDAVRSRAIGVAAAGLQTAQGAGVLIAGGIAELVSPGTAIGISAAVGSVAALAVGLVCRPTKES